MSWAFRKRLHSFLRSSLWVVPAISTLAAFLSVPLLRILDRRLGFQFFRFSPDGARAAAGIVSAAMLSFVVLFFSVLLLTVQIASSTLSPRIIARPFRSRALKTSLGLFVFTLIYSMAVVARGTEGNSGQLATAMVIVLTVISICVFLYVVEHVSKELRPATVMADVATEAVMVIREVYPLKLEQDTLANQPDEALLGIPAQVILHVGKPGVVQALDIRTLVGLAIRAACTIEVVPQVGDFVTSNDPVFRVYGGDLIPSFRTQLSMIFAKERGKVYVEEQAHRGADDRCTEASGGGASRRGCGARGGGFEAHALCLESEVRWHGGEPGPGSEAVAR
jgi:uncharacterized membrane protein